MRKRPYPTRGPDVSVLTLSLFSGRRIARFLERFGVDVRRLSLTIILSANGQHDAKDDDDSWFEKHWRR